MDALDTLNARFMAAIAGALESSRRSGFVRSLSNQFKQRRLNQPIGLVLAIL